MSFVQKADQGALFQNKKKSKPNHPDYNGKVVLSEVTLKALLATAVSGDPAIVYLAGWKKQGTAGPYLSLAASLPQAQDDRPKSRAPRPGVPEDDKDLPF